MKIKKTTAFTIGLLIVIAITSVVGAKVIPSGTWLKILNITSGTEVITMDREGNINATGNIQVDDTLWLGGGGIMCTNCINGTQIKESDLTVQSGWVNTSAQIWAVVDNDTFHSLDSTMSYTNLTVCTGTQILKMSGGAWVCAADDSGGVDSYINTTGDTATGNIVMSAANITLNHTESFIASNATIPSYIQFSGLGGNNITIGLA